MTLRQFKAVDSSSMAEHLHGLTLVGSVTVPRKAFMPRKRPTANFRAAVVLAVFATTLAHAKVHSNSMLPQPEHLRPADVDGDGLAEWVGYANDTTYGGYAISIARTDFATTPLLRVDRRTRTTGNRSLVNKLFTGHFLFTGQESVCVYTNTGRVQCFLMPSGSHSEYWYADQPATGSWAREILVGDFDGDGYDEVLLYDRHTAAIEMWKCNASTRQFAPVREFAAGNFGADAAIIAGCPSFS